MEHGQLDLPTVQSSNSAVVGMAVMPCNLCENII
jgi:hypothetical protein